MSNKLTTPALALATSMFVSPALQAREGHPFLQNDPQRDTIPELKNDLMSVGRMGKFQKQMQAALPEGIIFDWDKTSTMPCETLVSQPGNDGMLTVDKYDKNGNSIGTITRECYKDEQILMLSDKGTLYPQASTECANGTHEPQIIKPAEVSPPRATVLFPQKQKQLINCETCCNHVRKEVIIILPSSANAPYYPNFLQR